MPVLSPLQRAAAAALLPVAGLSLPAWAQSPAAATTDPAPGRLQSAAAWQSCQAQPDATRLACFDDWARSQQQLLQAVEAKARAAETSPVRDPNAVAATSARQEVAAALAAAQPAPTTAEGAAPPGPVGVLGVGLEQGCRDRQFSETSRFWELEAGSSCPTFGLRGFRPNTVALSASDRVNRQPSSPNPVNSASTPIDYGKQGMRLQLSVRTKLAGGLLTPEGSPLRDSLWAAYSQQSEWQVFNGGLSRPFRNTDHMPELIYVYPTTAQLPGGWVWRFSGLGVTHQSNGQSDPLSRSWNRVYLMTGLEKDQRFNLQARLWKRIGEDAEKDNNPDITRYVGRGDLALAWNVDSKNTVRSVYTGFNRRGSGKLEWTRSLGDGLGNSFSSLRLYTSVFHGYGDTLLDYNFKRTQFSIGLSLVDF